ncbi:MAG: HAD family phosphatase [Bacteroidales bacterium]|nr:HAD family phosphatase [Bacteroidales bacterium]MDD4529059.1 HAD family phosphatase [Bacteroidales bacterium]
MNNIAYLFDLDGVVIDTETEYTKIWTEIGNKYIPHINNFAFQIKGSHIRNIYENYLSHLSEQEWDGVVSYIRDLGQKMNYTYIEGAKEFLQELKIKNHLTALVTSSDNNKLETLFTKLPEIQSFFNVIVSSDDNVKGKPEPDPYLLAAKKLNIEPEKCIVFEDAIAGIESGLAANMFVIALSTTHSVEQLRKYTPKVIPNFKNFCLNCI